MDRISSLPDEIIHHILSFSELTLSIKTSVLSKRWKHQWKFTSNLSIPPYSDASIPFGNPKKGRPPFFSSYFPTHSSHPYGNCNSAAIRRCLDQYQAKQLKKLFIEVYQTNANCRDSIHKLFNFAVDRKVEDLTFISPWFIIPWFLFSSQSLEFLSLSYCHLYPPLDNRKSKNFLKSLSLTYFNDFGGALESLLSNCHSLQTLNIEIYSPDRFRQHSKLSICLPQLRDFRIIHGSTYPSIQIDAPNLQVVRMTDPFFVNLYLPNACDLQVVALHFHTTSLSKAKAQGSDYPNTLYPYEHPHKWGSNLKHMSNIRSLSLMPGAFRLIYDEFYVNGRRRFEFNNLKEFTLSYIVSSQTIYPLVNFFRGCPSLEEVCIFYCGVPVTKQFHRVEQLEVQPVDEDAELTCDFQDHFLQNLKRVKLMRFAGDLKQMLFVMFLWEKATILDCLRLEYDELNTDRLNFILNYISSLSKASPEATIISSSWQR